MKIKLSLLATGLLYVPVVFAQKQPNVVIILADDMGYGDVGCNNPYARVRTPAIDQLARNGIRFTPCYVENNITSQMLSIKLCNLYCSYSWYLIS